MAAANPDISVPVTVRTFAEHCAAAQRNLRAFLDACPRADVQQRLSVDSLRYARPTERIEAAIGTSTQLWLAHDATQLHKKRWRRGYDSVGSLDDPTTQALEQAVPTFAAEKERMLQVDLAVVREHAQSKKSRSDKNRRSEQNFLPDAARARPAITVPDPVAPGDVVLRVAVYHPSRPVKTHEFLVLGSQWLTALRDCRRFKCPSDFTRDAGDRSAPQRKSAFFFIENTFYNDTRDPEHEDYSAPIRAWVERVPKRSAVVGELKVKDMQSTRFSDLTLRLGARYLYCHQGTCEHTLVFTDVRQVHSLDGTDRALFPQHVFLGKVRQRKCSVCATFQAKYVTYGDRLTADNPCWFCETCFNLLHYDRGGRLLYDDFDVYEYEHD